MHAKRLGRRSLVGLTVATALLVGVAGCGGDDDSSASGEDFCAYATQVDNDASLGADLGEDAAAADPALLEDTITGAVEAMDGLVDRAPAEIEEDLKTVQSYFEQLEGVFSSYDYDFAKLVAEGAEDPDVQAVLGGDQTDLDAATQAVDDYLQENCGLSFDD